MLPMSANKLDSYGGRLTYVMKVRGYEKSKTAKALGISPNTFSNLFRPNAKWSHYTIRVCRYLRIRPEWLEHGQGEMEATDSELAQYGGPLGPPPETGDSDGPANQPMAEPEPGAEQKPAWRIDADVFVRCVEAVGRFCEQNNRVMSGELRARMACVLYEAYAPRGNVSLDEMVSYLTTIATLAKF